MYENLRLNSLSLNMKKRSFRQISENALFPRYRSLESLRNAVLLLIAKKHFDKFQWHFHNLFIS